MITRPCRAPILRATAPRRRQTPIPTRSRPADSNALNSPRGKFRVGRLQLPRRQLPKAKGVTRIDDPGGHGVGWYARVTFRGKTWSKYFADGAHKGTLPAFKKALTWRNEKEKELGKPRTDRIFSANPPRGKTKVPGVYQSKQSFVVAWSPHPGLLRREFISIKELPHRGPLRRIEGKAAERPQQH